MNKHILYVRLLISSPDIYTYGVSPNGKEPYSLIKVSAKDCTEIRSNYTDAAFKQIEDKLILHGRNPSDFEIKFI